MQNPRRIGVILAAGRGRRMGGIKQLAICSTPEGRKTLLAAAFDAIGPVCDEMIIVLGHEADSVVASLGRREFHRVEADADAPMFASIQAGLRAALAIDAGATVVLQPGDHPEVGQATLDALVTWSLKRPGLAVVPQFGERGGHPVFIPAEVARSLINAKCPGGLGQFWRDNLALCLRMPVDDAGVVRDVDVPGDLF